MWSNWSLLSALRRNIIRKRQVIWKYQYPEKMTFWENIKKFQGIPTGNFRDHRFPGVPEREFPMALAAMRPVAKLL